MIPVMILLPIVVGALIGVFAGIILKKANGKTAVLLILIAGITLTTAVGYWLNTSVFTNITLNYMLLGVSFSVAFSNMISEEKPETVTNYFILFSESVCWEQL